MNRITSLPHHVLSLGLAACCVLLALFSGIGSVGFWVLLAASALAAMYGVREFRADSGGATGLSDLS
jgi:hypothetical protein